MASGGGAAEGRHAPQVHRTALLESANPGFNDDGPPSTAGTKRTVRGEHPQAFAQNMQPRFLTPGAASRPWVAACMELL
jgi:hypothetical protein